MSWELRKVKDVPTVMDKTTGFYTAINRKVNVAADRSMTVCVRVDILDGWEHDTPIISFQGQGDDVRRALLQWFDDTGHCISADHAGYIGYEIHRAMVEPDYVQA